MARPINESRARFSNRGQSDRHGIAMSHRRALRARGAFTSVSLVQQLPDGDLRFARVALPFRDRVGNGIVEFEQTIAHRSQRRDTPETLGSAENRPSAAGRSAIGIMLENTLPILHDQHGNAAFAFSILCSACTIGWEDF